VSRWRALRCLLLLAALPTMAQPVPPVPVRWVTDPGGFLSDATRVALDRKLQEYEGQTGHSVLVWIDRSTGGVPIQDFGVRAFHAWGVGRKGKSDGLVIFLFTDDRKVRIEVGYGLEDKVPDAIASRIIHEQMTPLLAAGNHDRAIQAGVDAVLAAIGGAEQSAAPSSAPVTAKRPPLVAPHSRGPEPFWSLGCIPVALLLVFFAWLLKFVLGAKGDGESGGAPDFSSSTSTDTTSTTSSSGGDSSSSSGGDFSGGGGDAGGGGADGSW
jgi:uncharacterized protein